MYRPGSELGGGGVRNVIRRVCPSFARREGFTPKPRVTASDDAPPPCTHATRGYWVGSRSPFAGARKTVVTMNVRTHVHTYITYIYVDTIYGHTRRQPTRDSGTLRTHGGQRDNLKTRETRHPSMPSIPARFHPIPAGSAKRRRDRTARYTAIYISSEREREREREKEKQGVHRNTTRRRRVGGNGRVPSDDT